MKYVINIIYILTIYYLTFLSVTFVVSYNWLIFQNQTWFIRIMSTNTINYIAFNNNTQNNEQSYILQDVQVILNK